MPPLHVHQGKDLSNSIQEIHKQFFISFGKFRSLEYSVFDETTEFEADFAQFKHLVRDLDRQLSYVVCSWCAGGATDGAVQADLGPAISVQAVPTHQHKTQRQ